MKHSIFLAALASASPALAADPAEILQADRAFAAMSIARGPRVAFKAWLAPTATMINVGELKSGSATELVADFPTDPAAFDLDWTPSGGIMSDDGTLGVTWGTYKRIVNGRLVATGAYSTTWHRAADGRWKVVEDTGTEVLAR